MIAVDASVILGWLLDDSEKKHEDKDFIRQLVVEDEEVVAPKLLILEVINSLVLRHHFTRNKALGIMKQLDDLEIDFIDINEMDIANILKLMTACKLTAYDAWYLQVAKQKDCQLITHDKELLRADKKTCITPSVFRGRV